MFRTVRKLILIALFAAVTAAGVILWLSPDPEYTVHEWIGGSRFWRFDESITQVARKHGVDPLLVKAMVWRESRFDPDKVGTSGERGLMQVMEGAAQDWTKAEKIETFVPTDLFDPKTNLEVGVWYIARALERWKDRDDPVPFALAEYNAGRSRADRWLAATNLADKAEAADFVRAIDFPTTRSYVAEITRRYQFYRDRERL